MNRRNFLKLSSTCCVSLPLISSAGCTHKKLYNPDQDIIIGGGRFKKNNEIHDVLAIANLQQRDTQVVDSGFLPHGIYINPNDKKRLVTFEKNGTSAAIIDLNRQEVITQFKAVETNLFSGHGAFDETGKLIYSIESDIDSSAGKIIVRDSSSLKVIDQLPTYGKNPHECKLHNDEQLITVANSGTNNSPASITTINTQDKKLVDEIKLEGDPINSCHFAISDNTNLIVTSAPKSSDQTGYVRISDQQKTFLTMIEPKLITEKLLGEALNISIDEQHDIAAITHPLANLLTFWSITDRKLSKAISVPNPRGITLTMDKKHYIVSYGINPSAILVSTKDLTADKNSIMQPTYISGEHSINWSKTLTEIMPGKRYS